MARRDQDDGCPELADKQAAKGRMLDELCAIIGWHRNDARKTLTPRLSPRWSGRERRPPTYAAELVVALRFC